MPASIGSTAFHTKRLESRATFLGVVFSKNSMDRVWKKYVRAGLRDQEIPDLHDHNDFHWRRNELFENLHSEIVTGRYTALQSTPVRVEKRLGVTRTVVLPTAADCVVLQCIVEHLLPLALARQPSPNSFFSRSHGFSKPEWKFEKDYIWFKRWAKFSKLRLSFTSTHSYICTTDIANYFDNIDYTHLRNIISTLDNTDEVTLDILFAILDKISWRPDYLPPPGVGLPQVNFDAPRLLSHVYLYEVDEFLKSATNHCFVRWVDDMTFAVPDIAAGKRTLRDLDQLLLTRGLRLNAGKTAILSSNQARKFFQSAENSYLDKSKDKLQEPSLSMKKKESLLADCEKRFDLFCTKPPYGHSEKIVKRYIGIFSEHRRDHAIKFCCHNLTPGPGLRDAIFRYFIAIGPNNAIFLALRNYVLGENALDDSSLLQIARILTDWKVDPGSKYHRNILNLAANATNKNYIGKNVFYFYFSLWIFAKYGRRGHIFDLCKDFNRTWRTSEFLSRQVAATIPKFRGSAQGNQIRRQIQGHQFKSAYSIIDSLDHILSTAPKISNSVRFYILNGKHSTTYSIQRFLIAIHVLSNTKFDSTARRALRDEALLYISDPIYTKVLAAIKF